jgi:hypothetical protein
MHAALAQEGDVGGRARTYLLRERLGEGHDDERQGLHV